MKLIRELTEDVEYVVEGKEDEKKSYYIKGPFMVSEMKNKNGRVYPKPVLENAVNNFLTQVKENRALGELGHPSTPTINHDRASHLITELSFSGNYVLGKAKVLSTPMGNIVKTFLDEGVKLGVSSRGLGSLKPNKAGIMEVQNDYRIATVDVVSEPSGPNCWVDGIMESADWVFGPDGWTQVVAEQFQTKMKKMSSKELEEHKLRLFENYLKLI